MTSIPDGFPVSLRTWPPTPDNGSNSSLATMIQRINAERGGFLKIDEDSIRQEIADAEAGVLGAEAEGDEEESSEEEGDVEGTDREKELTKAREEMIGQLESAHQNALHALDVISLLLSKDSPVQAGSTISPYVREHVGLGTLGLDKLQASRVTDKQKQNDRQVARGWKSQSLSNNVDALLASATRLEKEIETETKFWGQVLDINEKGWAICRMPQAKHVLGVRFGFSETTASFKSQSLAPLNRNEDGSISLDRGGIASEPQALRVRIQFGEEIIGTSSVPQLALEEGPVEALILQARNTIFAVELWQELNRESRNLQGSGVSANGDTISFAISSNKTAVVDLFPLTFYTPPPPAEADYLAEGLSLTLRLLLGYAHKQTHRRRTFRPVELNTERPNPPFNILRPLLTLLRHQSTISTLNSVLRPLCVVLSNASVTKQPKYSLVPTHFPIPPHVPVPERTISSLTDRLGSQLTFEITESTTLNLIIRTSTTQLATSFFIFTLSDNSPVLELCPPPAVPNTPPLANIRIAVDYIYLVACAALANEFVTIPNVPESSSDEHDFLPPVQDGIIWTPTLDATTLQLLNSSTTALQKTKQLNFSIIPSFAFDATSTRSLDAQSQSDRNGERTLGQERNRSWVKLRVSWKYTNTGIADLSTMHLDPHDPKDVQKLGDRLFEELGLENTAKSEGGSNEKSDARKAVKGGPSKGRREGEGYYEWIGWENEHEKKDGLGWDDGEGEVLKSLKDVVDGAKE